VVFSPHLDATRSTFAGNHLWKIYKLFIKKIINSVDWIIVASKFELNLLIQQFSINQNKVTIIPHGVDIINTEKFRIKTNDIRLLYVGYLIKRKRVDYILKSLHSLIYDYKIKNILLTIIGEGSEKKNLFKLSKKLKIDDKIIWRTFLPRKELEKEFKNSDVVLLLSESEAYGITVAEALALGTPVIVTKQTALKEFLNEPGCFGVSYPPNPKEVAKLILKIINTGVKVGPFSNRKIRLWNEVVSEYEKVYIDLLKCKNV
ncbi:MAG: glycosyltransferase family 4 protein, partial [Nitrososphaeria archaeon]|nr:glycosyltransferase family 4 protein [Nitrososphaeria archaeon]